MKKRTILGEFSKDGQSVESFKNNIRTLVDEYMTIEPFKSEYELFLKSHRKKQSRARLDGKSKFGELGKTDMVIRIMYEIPETLHAMMQLRLNKLSKDWLGSKEGQQWFATTFKQFRVSEKV